MPKADSPASVDKQCDVSVVISTYNRCDVLRDAISGLLEQETAGLSFELVVVDNNSTDQTRRTVESFIEHGATHVRYIFEPKQGVSYGRNAGIQASRAPIVAFVDDDIRATPNWVATIKRLFDEHPDLDFIGGKVLPPPSVELPRWLSSHHWAPIAILDYGDSAFYIDTGKPLCLLTANIAFRREVFDIVGYFSPELQRVKDGIGSMEDLELQMRMWRHGRRGFYSPELVVITDIPADRLTRSYHRRWHKGHGHHYARLRLEEIEKSESGRLFDVPAHLYRQALTDAAQWIKHWAMGKRDLAFMYETHLYFFAGFYSMRRRDFLVGRSNNSISEIASFIRTLARSRKDRGTQEEAG